MLTSLLALSLAAAPADVARSFIEEVAQGKLDAATARFTKDMGEAMGADELGKLWKDLEGELGAFGKVTSAKGVEKQKGLEAVSVGCAFARGTQLFRVVVDEQGKVGGLFVRGPDGEGVAARLIALLGKGDAAGATAMFDDPMKAALPPDKLLKVWSEVTGPLGRFKEVSKFRFEPVERGRYLMVFATCAFEKGPRLVKVVLDRSSKVSGLFFPHEDPGEVAAWASPPYAKPSAFEEKEVEVRAAVALPATLTLPKGKGPFPGVVLVHGSGPADRDETVGGHKVFKDLAWGLSSQGVAVLRYDKRTRVSASGVKTAHDEVVDGAAAAVALLSQTPKVDPKRVVLLGHSQGGQLAPRIAKGEPRVKGLVLLAGPARPEADLWVEQAAYLSGGDPAAVAAAEAARRAYFDPKLSPQQTVEVFGSKVTGEYLLDARAYSPTDEVAKLELPVLVLQGARDYQVRVTDYLRWQDALKGKPRALFKLYPGLNHLFSAGDGPGLSLPDEYRKAGHVAPAVIEDVAAFAKGLK